MSRNIEGRNYAGMRKSVRKKGDCPPKRKKTKGTVPFFPNALTAGGRTRAPRSEARAPGMPGQAAPASCRPRGIIGLFAPTPPSLEPLQLKCATEHSQLPGFCKQRNFDGRKK